ncbi:octapeptide-repeat protein T2-like [Ambystoma mexicanum]|uniref:octapeptide-repeat protein T2-like n=1 Tax=Ambystoma mexicanum TaxID=8296 RepID=UPI0037E86814
MQEILTATEREKRPGGEGKTARRRGSDREGRKCKTEKNTGKQREKRREKLYRKGSGSEGRKDRKIESLGERHQQAPRSASEAEASGGIKRGQSRAKEPGALERNQRGLKRSDFRVEGEDNSRQPCVRPMGPDQKQRKD